MIRQQKLKEFFLSDQSSHSSSDEQDEMKDLEENKNEPKKRGAPKEPIRWTRVFKVSKDLEQSVQIYKIEDDEKEFFENYNNQIWPENDSWTPLFCPQDFKLTQNHLKCKDYELEESELIEFAKQTTDIRKTLQLKADQIYQMEGEYSLKMETNLNNPPHKYRRGYSGPRSQIGDQISNDDQNISYRATNPKRKGGSQLTNFELTDIVHQALVGLKSNREIAENHQTKEKFVSQLVVKMKKDPLYLKNKFEKEDKSEAVIQLIIDTTTSILNSGEHIWQAAQVRNILLKDHNIEVTLSKIRHVFKSQMSMQFKRIKRIPFLGNAQRCLVMRHLYAIKMLDILQKGKTVWNFDESFLNESFFVRRKWCQKGQQNSIPKQAVSPRISVLLAISSEGEAYMCLSQSKTYSERVMLFFEYFFRQLDLAQPNWRDNSVLLMDGAPYHTSDETIEYMKRNQVPLFIAAPYAYDAAACEMYFSYLKSQDLNSANLSTGKRPSSENVWYKNRFDISDDSAESIDLQSLQFQKTPGTVVPKSIQSTGATVLEVTKNKSKYWRSFEYLVLEYLKYLGKEN